MITVLAVSGAVAASYVRADPPLVVGVFVSTGSEGTAAALRAAGGFDVRPVTGLTEPVLFRHDAVILGSVKGLSESRWRDAVELYVRCGGGLLLHHDATGHRGWPDSLFPQLFKGTGTRRSRAIRVVAPEHPIMAGVPEQFEHAYLDHVILEARAGGAVLAEDENGTAVVVAGQVEGGRVVGNGMITGYAAPAGSKQREQAPEGGERTLLLNAVRWTGAARITRAPAAELAGRRDRVADKIALRHAAEMEGVDGRRVAAVDPKRDWFCESMLNEQGFVHPPVAGMDGRFFFFEGITVSITNRMGKGREYGEILGIVKQLKWLGVTDIISHTGGPVTNLRYLSELPGISFSRHAKSYGFDYLHVLCKAAHEAGLNVWGFWHPNRGGDYKIGDGKGAVYANYLDIKDPRVLERGRVCLDELAARYNTFGNFKGVFLDELWHPFVYDRMEGQAANFAEFCRARFGEAPPDDLDMSALLAKGREWHDPADVWWRRYVLFRNTFAVDYIRAVTEYANSKGLQVMPQIGFGFSWFQGHGDTYNLARAGNIMWSYEHRNNSRYEHYPQDRVICGTHTRSPGGYQCVALIRGCWGSQFAMEQTWLPIGYGKNPRSLEVLARTLRANREWYGARTLSRFAVLTNRLGLDLSHGGAAARAFRDNEEAVQLALSSVFHVPMLMVQDAEFFSRYKVLIAPRHSLSFLSPATYEALLAYVEGGGHLLLLDAPITTSRDDHTGVTDRTRELTGVERGTAPAATSASSTRVDVRVAPALGDRLFSLPALTAAPVISTDPGTVTLARVDGAGTVLAAERRLGKGRVASIHFGIAALLSDRATCGPAVAFLRALLESLHKPPIRVDGNLLVFNSLRKGAWVVVTFVARDSKFDTTLGKEYPGRGKLYVDMKALGVDADRYKVINLARDREMMPQGEHWDFWGRTGWTGEVLARDGIDVYIAPNSLVDLDLPSACEDEYVRKYIIPRWPSQSRSFEHDIIAIAPANEASILGQ